MLRSVINPINKALILFKYEGCLVVFRILNYKNLTILNAKYEMMLKDQLDQDI